MSRFGNAQEGFLSPEFADTERWFPDELIDQLFFIWDDDQGGNQTDNNDL